MENAGKSIAGTYQGEGGPLFKLAMVTSLLTLVTLGIYRFWAKTRIRKYIWSSASGDGDSFEYTGTGLEKFLGFLVAIVILAIYLGIVQMGLFYFGLNLFAEPTTEAEMLAQMAAFYISFFAVLPLIFFAQYRSRRYKLARTRWRGVRFGAEKGAWGYAFRKIGHMILTGLTLGILLPRQTFLLEKYVTNRSWYGTEKFEQGGRWSGLYPAMKHIFIGLVILIAGIIIGAVLQTPAITVISGIVGYIWLLVGIVSYRVNAFIYLTAHKELANAIGFTAAPRTGQIIKLYFIGALLIGLILTGITFVIGMAAAAIFAGSIDLAALEQPGADPFTEFNVATLIPVGIAYVVTLAMVGAMSLALIIQPIIRHVIGSITIHNADALDRIGQRDSAEGVDADGFADALDIGGAI